MRSTDTFRFEPVTLLDTQNEIKSLDPSKVTTNNIPPKIPLQTVEATANTLQLLVNNVLSNSEFPENLKLEDVTSALKQKDPFISSFKNFRKINAEANKQPLSPYLYRYRKGFSTQHALLSLMEN